MAEPPFQKVLLCCTIKIKLQREVKLWLTLLIAEPSNHICLLTQQKSEKVLNKQSCKFKGTGGSVILHVKHEEHNQKLAHGKPVSKLKLRVRTEHV